MTDAPKSSLGSRVIRKAFSVLLTLGVAAASVGAVMFGAEALASRAADVPAPGPAARAQVSVAPIAWQDSYMVARQYIGQVEAGSTVALSFELGGRLTELAVGEGDEIAAGQVIARLDTALLQAEADRLSASRAATATQLTFAESRLSRAVSLNTEGFVSQDALDEARTTRDELQNRIAEIDASLQSVQINIDKSVLTAPFAGRIGSQFVDEGVALTAGQSVASLIDTHRVEVRIGLPLDLPAAALQDAQIAVAGETFNAALIHFRPDIDPVTRTRTALFALDTQAGPVLGQTATLMLQNQIAQSGAWVQMDALQEGAGSAWTVLVVEDAIVRPAIVEVVHAEADRAFVRGSFQDGAMLIQSGAHRVVPGQMVDVLAGEG